jgi:branched-subunit amino acid permease
VAIIFSIGDFLSGLGLGNNLFTRMNLLLPLGKQGMSWLLPTIVAIILVQIFSRFTKTSA